jgi:hypothetical protein
MRILWMHDSIYLNFGLFLKSCMHSHMYIEALAIVW